MIEKWRPVVGYEGGYEASNLGRIRSLKIYRPKLFHRILKAGISPKGYHYVCLRKDGIKKTIAVHKIVLEAFIEVKPVGKQCAHWDGDPSNNRSDNLRWTTAKENIADRCRHGRTIKGENQQASKLDKKAVKTIRIMKEKGFSSCETAHLASVSQSTVWKIWKGLLWKHV